MAIGAKNSLIAYTKFDNGKTNQHFLYAVLVDRNGQESSAGEIQVAVDNSTHLFPSVAFDGTNYLVVWQQQPTDAAGAATIHVSGTFVSPDGVVLNSTPIAISTATNGQFTPSVAFDGTNYLVLWLDGRNMNAGSYNYDIYGTRVTPAGALLDGTAATGGFPIDVAGTQSPGSPNLTFNGSEYWVAWVDGGFSSSGSDGVRLARVSTGGMLLTPAGGIALSGPPSGSTIFAFPVIAPEPPGGSIVWLNNTEVVGSQKSLLGVSIYSF